jgi:GTP-binding protein LepA
VERVPPPSGDPKKPLRALVFDSHYDPYKGVIAYVRVVDGELSPADELRMMATKAESEPMEIGIFAPLMAETGRLGAGEVGYVATGLKDIRRVRVGETITTRDDPAGAPLPGYQAVKPMVFAGLYPIDSEDFPLLRDALEKLQLNDAALVFEPETSQALNYGFRCGFLGLFHMEIVQERLEREYDLDLIATAPGVEYHILTYHDGFVTAASPAEFPDEAEIDEIHEPWMRIQVFTPVDYMGSIMDLITKKRGEYVATEYLDRSRLLLTCDIPLAELIVDFYDWLKSVSRGYASLDYQFLEYRAGDLVKLEMLVNKEPVDALALIVHRDDAYRKGQALVNRLKEVIPQQLFAVPLQASLGNKVIARTDVKALRKDVLAKCYGGDVTRKRKLLEKQKKGKRRMKRIGQVDVPQEAFMALLKLDGG